jgi:hypothetical protein
LLDCRAVRFRAEGYRSAPESASSYELEHVRTRMARIDAAKKASTSRRSFRTGSVRSPKTLRRCSTTCWHRRRSRASVPGRRDCSMPCATWGSAAASACGHSWWWNRLRCSMCRGQNSLMAGAALECVHCYSLAHDDLPAMDNDDLREAVRRRTRPSMRRPPSLPATVFSPLPSTSLAARDAFRRRGQARSWSRRCARAPAWRHGGGQMLDLAAEGRFDCSPPRLGEQEVKSCRP